MTQPLHDLEIDDFLARSVKIEPLGLQEEFVQLPADLAYWNARFATAMKAHLVAKMISEKTEARLMLMHRERLIAITEKGRVTEALVNAAVTLDPAMSEVRLALIDHEVEKVRLHGVVDAIRSKRDMIISLGAHIRAEMAHDPKLREVAAATTDAQRNRDEFPY